MQPNNKFMSPYEKMGHSGTWKYQDSYMEKNA